MNDQLLRARLHDAVDEIHPTSRLHQIVDVPAPPRNRPDPRRQLLVAAVVLLVLIIVGVTLVRISSEGEQATGIDTASSTTSSSGQTTTSTAPEQRVGDQVSVDLATMPAGMHLLDELPRTTGQDLMVVARFGLDDGLWDADGPYLRVVLSREVGIGSRLTPEMAGTLVGKVDGHDAYQSTDPYTDPTTQSLPGKLADLENPWITLVWATGPDEIVSVQAKGVDDAVMLAVATRSVIVRR